MNLVDSSAWLEYFADGPNAEFFAAAVENEEELLVPAIVIYEVTKRLLQLTDERTMLRALAQLHRGHIVTIDEGLALQAAQLSCEVRLPMADSLILASARHHGATIWTQDVDFAHLEGVVYRAREKPSPG